MHGLPLVAFAGFVKGQFQQIPISFALPPGLAMAYLPGSTSIMKVNGACRIVVRTACVVMLCGVPDIRSDHSWLEQIQGLDSLSFSVRDLTVNSQGHVYITGTFRGTISIRNESYLAEGVTGTTDGFVIKYNDVGAPMWVRRFGGPHSDWGSGICSAVSGVYVCGFLEDPAPIDGTEQAPKPGHFAFLAKYDHNGNLLWRRLLRGGERHATGRSVAADGKDDCYMASIFQDYLDWGDARIEAVGHDSVVGKYSKGGQLLWRCHVKSNGHIWINSLAPDERGGVFMAGYFQGTASVGGHTFISEQRNNAFIAHTTAKGEIEWARHCQSDGLVGWQCVVWGGNGVGYVCGSGAGEVALGDLRLKVPEPEPNMSVPPHVRERPPSEKRGFLLARFNEHGDFAWVRSWSRSAPRGRTAAMGVSVDPDGNPTIMGTFISPMWVEDAMVHPRGKALFIAKYDPLGHLVALDRLGSAGEAMEGWAIKIDQFGNLYVGGTARGIGKVGPFELNPSATQGFVTKQTPQSFKPLGPRFR